MASFGFTRASGQDIFSIDSNEASSSETARALNGEDVRQFYENLTKENKDKGAPTSSDSKKSLRKRRRRKVSAAERQQPQTVVQRGNNSESEGNPRRDAALSERSMELLGLRLLRSAHEGDTTGLRDLLSKGADINFQVKC